MFNPTEVAQLCSLYQEASSSGPSNHFCLFIDCTLNAIFLTNKIYIYRFLVMNKVRDICQADIVSNLEESPKQSSFAFWLNWKWFINQPREESPARTEPLQLGQISSKIRNGNLLPKLFWPTVIVLVIEKNFWNLMLKAKNNFIQTVKVQNSFWNRKRF